METNVHVKLTLLCFALLCGLSNCSKKKGLALWGAGIGCDDLKLFGNVTWWYDWRNDIAQYHSRLQNCNGVDSVLNNYVPMITCGASWCMDTVSSFPAAAQYVLGFNEPHHKYHMEAAEAARLWPTIEQHAGNRTLVSPAVPCRRCKDGHHQWYDDFFRLCKNCRVDVIATHIYSCNVDATMHTLEKMSQIYGKKIWLTEFACPQNTTAQGQLHFMQRILPRLEAAPFIERYSWFSTRILHDGYILTTASLLEKDSATLTPLGQFYRNFHQQDAGAIIG